MSGLVLRKWLTAGVVASAVTCGLLAASLAAAPGHRLFSRGDVVSHKPMPMTSERLIGASRTVAGAKVSTWATLMNDGSIEEVGVTVPLKLALNPPPRPGKGPDGAIAVVPFPRVVRNRTYFNHFEMHWNPNGHPPACCFMKPHFDLHFYGVPVRKVWTYNPPDRAMPDKDHLPAGYIYPGRDKCVPEMGVHASKPEDLDPNKPFTYNMVAGFYNGKMNFIEPMVLRKFLLTKKNFTLDAPRPAVLGRKTLYPTKFAATYDGKTNSYEFVFKDFVRITR